MKLSFLHRWNDHQCYNQDSFLQKAFFMRREDIVSPRILQLIHLHFLTPGDLQDVKLSWQMITWRHGNCEMNSEDDNIYIKNWTSKVITWGKKACWFSIPLWNNSLKHPTSYAVIPSLPVSPLKHQLFRHTQMHTCTSTHTHMHAHIPHIHTHIPPPHTHTVITSGLCELRVVQSSAWCRRPWTCGTWDSACCRQSRGSQSGSCPGLKGGCTSCDQTGQSSSPGQTNRTTWKTPILTGQTNCTT